jgi:hypothetical protein
VSCCPEHADLMLELARGRLDDERALQAETVRLVCASCSRTWEDTHSSDAFAAVEAAVEEAFAMFEPPVRRRHGWLAAAAAAVLAIGLGTTVLVWRSAEKSPRSAVGASSESTVLSALDFEDGVVSAANDADDAPTPAGPTESGSAVFRSDLESGDLSGWSSHS